MYTVGAGGGLADRTRVLFSYLQFVRSQQQSLTMLWEDNNHLFGRFEDVFEPVRDVSFVYGKRLLLKHKDSLLHWGPRPHPDFKEVTLLVRELVPLPPVIEGVRATLDRLRSGFIALHVRRFDLEAKQASMSFDVFDRFLEAKLKPEQKIFLATDATPTQERFREKYGDRIVVFRDITWLGYYGRKQHIWRRQTDLFHSVVDLFVCTFGDDFLGTQRDFPRYSSPRRSGFSVMIEKFRSHYQQSGLPDWL